ncbi:MAG TPA: hydrogenase formation protein HypD [Phycisphaerae bacterium]|nr:hydrogenase formation protein HypD [Phycisphaerae bacterium]
MTAAAFDEHLDAIKEIATRLPAVQLMEVCGTHTVALFRTGIKSLLPANVRLLSGPGCPVCVTSQGYIDAACTLARRDGVTVCTYGDMVRVPGRGGSLEVQRARGARIRVVYSARDAVHLAAKSPELQVVFLAVGFETTAPATAAALLEAESLGLKNFSVLAAHKLVVPAMEVLLADGDVPIDGFICPGHVSVIIGAEAYQPVVSRYHKPCVVTGFEPAGMLAGIAAVLRQIAAGDARIENVYSVAVTPGGNRVALDVMDRVFEPAPARWRAMGELPASGLRLRPAYAAFDAWRRFDLTEGDDYDPPGCRCGEVIQGKSQPADCALFATACTPLNPIGPCMVSSEGTCAAWYKYHRPPVEV